MIDAITCLGVNGSQVQLNLPDNVYPVNHFEVTYDVNTEDNPKQQQHGSWPAPDYIGMAHVTIEGSILAQNAADYWNKRFAFMQPFSPLPQQGFTDTVQLIFQLSGWFETLECMCALDGGLPNPPLTADIPALSNFQINLKMRDPRFYSGTVQQLTLAPPGGLGGLTFPVTFPVTFSGGTGSTGAVINNGTAFSDPVWTVTGPCSNPQLFVQRVDGSTDTWGLTGVTIPSGSSLVVDFKAKTVVQDDTYNLFKYINSASKWWELYTGTNVVGFTASNTSADTEATCVWQNAYFI